MDAPWYVAASPPLANGKVRIVHIATELVVLRLMLKRSFRELDPTLTLYGTRPGTARSQLGEYWPVANLQEITE